ncbi:MAG: hypothetical protein KGL39_23875 [Patescibacteria group bacterium]|nr:hypothetical protein [Patescibacteria group bacterium]
MTDIPPFPPFNPNPPSTETVPPEPRRRGRKPKPEGVAPAPEKRKKPTAEKLMKIDLRTALELSSMLNADDQGLFEKLVDMLQEAGKPARDRLLAAIEKVFG